MNTQFIQDIIRELKSELYNAKKKAKALNATDEAQLYYNGVIVGLQVSISKYEEWLYNTQPHATKKRKRKGTRTQGIKAND